MRMSGQVNDSAACEALSEEMSNAEHGRLEEQNIGPACSFPNHQKWQQNSWAIHYQLSAPKSLHENFSVVH